MSDFLALQKGTDLIVSIKVKPGARMNKITVDEGLVYVKVSPIAEDDKANMAVIALLAKKLSVAKSRILLLEGKKSRMKKFLIKDYSLDEFNQAAQSFDKN